jgi:hypothetical protein
MVGFAKVIPLLLFAAIVLQQKNIAKGNKGDARKDDGADFHADSPFLLLFLGLSKNHLWDHARANQFIHGIRLSERRNASIKDHLLEKRRARLMADTTLFLVSSHAILCRPYKKMKTLSFLLFFLLVGCVTDSPLYSDDHSSVSQIMAQKRAMTDLKCSEALADRPIRSDRMEDWSSEPLYSEYKVWSEGCGRSINYVVVCRIGDLCRFADQPLPQEE